MTGEHHCKERAAWLVGKTDYARAQTGFVNLKKRIFVYIYGAVPWLFMDLYQHDYISFASDKILAAVEVLNAALGVVRTGVIQICLQVVGRNSIRFIIFGILEEMHKKPVVFFVFYLWSIIEIFRYPFYMLGCYNTEWKTLTWLWSTV
ncbi:very-long-chain (3R)-3-hydroxyacyl-CoA dehydratase [Thalassophryne amazonica]|uniref:very-long-chain (3R)-3-hydroxyacyl-CoA dehydratase n=1 Tax=Thalassophryne amazonica TaxID=390379 RepID=UPI001471A18F|nr:very-long-chain (3R)-3-hydroxyacyl-CoA dehydratase [Thalassophryne amazonica]